MRVKLRHALEERAVRLHLPKLVCLFKSTSLSADSSDFPSVSPTLINVVIPTITSYYNPSIASFIHCKGVKSRLVNVRYRWIVVKKVRRRYDPGHLVFFSRHLLRSTLRLYHLIFLSHGGSNFHVGHSDVNSIRNKSGIEGVYTQVSVLAEHKIISLTLDVKHLS